MTSRRYLYAMGEPIGEGATRRHGARVIYGDGGGGGSSSSSADQTSATTYADKRLVTDGGSIGISGDGNGLQLSSTDARSVTDASTSWNQTIDSSSVEAGRAIALAGITNNATNVDHLLSAAEMLFSQSQKTLDANVSLTGQLAGTAQTAYADAASQASGNKNLILVGLAVVGIFAVKALGK